MLKFNSLIINKIKNVYKSCLLSIDLILKNNINLFTPGKVAVIT